MVSTKIVKVDPLNPRDDDMKEAAQILRRGGLVIIPTETVYGIAANMLNNHTLDRLYRIKERMVDKPFSLHIDKKEKIEDFTKDVPTSAYKLMDKFWPGPLTLVLKSKDRGTVGIRMPDNEIARKVILEAGVPIVCPSANISGKPAPVNFQEAIKDFDGLVDFAIDGGTTRLKTESSVVDLTTEPLRILREGAIKKEEIEAVVKKKIVLFVCTGNSCRSVMAKGLLEKELKEKGRTDTEVLAAGIISAAGLGATENTIGLLRKEGVDVSGYRSQQVTKEMIKKSDLILVMERLHEERILQFIPEVKNRVFLLKEFAKIGQDNLDIVDPIGKPMELYAQIFATIKEAIERISNII